MPSTMTMRCEDCGYIYDPSVMDDVPLVDQVGWECPGNDQSCAAGVDRYEIADDSPLHDADDLESDVLDDSATDGFDPEAHNPDLETKRVDKAIGDLAREYEEGELVLQPDWQRYYVWSNKQASQLIESIFLKLPIPLIYLALESDGTYSVVDGQQRLTALIEFLRNKRLDHKTGDVKLSGLEVLASLNGNTYKDLPKSQQRFLKQAELSVVRINSKSDPKLKLNVFQRLNTGAVKLNAQELRNAAFRGPYNDLLRLLAKNPTFLKMLNATGKPDIRMLDVELVLRFSTWLNRGWLAMNKSLTTFLDEEMELGTVYNQKKLKNIEQKFKDAVDLTWQAFGTRAFRRYSVAKEGGWEQRQMNKALYDVVMFGFTRKTKPQFWPHLEAVKESLIDLMATDPTFMDAITATTNDPKKVDYRFKTWMARIDEIVTDDPAARTFSRELKQQLFDSDNICSLCSQEIHDLDDAHVHHVHHYWRGGATIPENAALVHRFCNLREGGGGTV